MPPFTLVDVEKLREVKPRRRCFAESPDALSADGSYRLSFKFGSVARLFEAETGLATSDGQYGPWSKFQAPDEIDRARKWKAERNKLVFLRDNLPFSVALDFNFASEGNYTALGQAESNAKQKADEEALKTLTTALVDAVNGIGLFKGTDAVCAIPPAPGKLWDLPTELARRVAIETGKENVSGSLKFAKDKASVKALSLEAKWNALKAASLEVDNDVNGKNIILIDDKYQSGTTAQFTASKLYEAGAKEVLGLYCVKTWRDTDNR